MDMKKFLLASVCLASPLVTASGSQNSSSPNDSVLDLSLYVTENHAGETASPVEKEEPNKINLGDAHSGEKGKKLESQNLDQDSQISFHDLKEEEKKLELPIEIEEEEKKLEESNLNQNISDYSNGFKNKEVPLNLDYTAARLVDQPSEKNYNTQLQIRGSMDDINDNWLSENNYSTWNQTQVPYGAGSSNFNQDLPTFNFTPFTDANQGQTSAGLKQRTPSGTSTTTSTTKKKRWNAKDLSNHKWPRRK